MRACGRGALGDLPPKPVTGADDLAVMRRIDAPGKSPMTAASHSLCPCHHQPDITSTYCVKGKRSPSAAKRLAS